MKSLFLIGLIGVASGCDDWHIHKDCDETIAQGYPGSCPDPTAERGTQQGKCRQSTETGGKCDPGLTCIANVCIPCGEDREICCLGGINQPDTCDPGLACQWPGDDINDEYKYCTDDCGIPGKPCCDQDYDHCPGGGVCNDDYVCESIADPCNSGNDVHTVSIIQYGCVQQTVPFAADTPEAIAECTALILTNYNASDATLSAVDEQTICEDFCKETSLLGTETWPVCYVVADGPQACQDGPQYDCESQDCNWTAGTCP